MMCAEGRQLAGGLLHVQRQAEGCYSNGLAAGGPVALDVYAINAQLAMTGPTIKAN